MKKFIVVFFLLSVSVLAQAPSQIKQVLPGTPSVVFNWGYNQADEQYIDSFVLQHTAYSATAVITNPYSVEVVITQKTIRSATHTLPVTTAGQKSFYRMVARKQGLADSVPSNVVQIEVVPTPPTPQNLNIARFTEIEFTQKSLNGVKLWFITKAL
jgi:hypothetical protein